MSRGEILMVGTVVHAKDEFKQLSDVTKVNHYTKENSRQEFLKALDDGTYSNVKVISRTFESVSMTGRFDEELVSHLPESVKFICHNGAGYDQIDVVACTKRGIRVSSTPGAVNNATANVAIWLILSALRTAYHPQRELRAGRWRGDMTLGRDPDGLTLGILGLGGIGKATARRAVAFGFRLQYADEGPPPAPGTPSLREQLGTDYEPRRVPTEELLRTSDVISIHVPLLPSTRGLVNARSIASMRDGVVIVNSARGPIVDEAALVDALDSGKVFAAGLDVFDREPEISQRLLQHPRAVLVPHIGTMTVQTQKKMECLVIDNVKTAITQDKLVTQVPTPSIPSSKL